MTCFFFDNCISDKVVDVLKICGAEDDRTQLIHIKDVTAFAPDGGRTVADTIWIPHVAEQEWVAITVDKRVRINPQERALLEKHGLRLVHIANGYEQLKLWDHIKFFVNHWQSIQKDTFKCKRGQQFQVSINGKVSERK